MRLLAGLARLADVDGIVKWASEQGSWLQVDPYYQIKFFLFLEQAKRDKFSGWRHAKKIGMAMLEHMPTMRDKLEGVCRAAVTKKFG